MNKNIDQLLIEVSLKGDVSGTLPIFNYNYNILNKIISKGGFIYLPNQILLTNDLFKIKSNKTKDTEIIKKLREVFTSESALNNFYKENSNKIEPKSDKLIKKNLEFILNLFFKQNEDFYLSQNKFKIKSLKILNNSTNYLNTNKIKKNLLSKSCSNDKKNKVECTIQNLEDKIIETYKEKEIKFIKKIDPELSDSEVNKKAYKKAIEKYQSGNEDQQIKKLANDIIIKKNINNYYKKAGIKYIFNDKNGIVLNANNLIIDNIKIELELIYEENIIKRKKFHIERGNCKTKKSYIKNLWKKLTKKNKSTSETSNNKEKKWIYIKTNKGYELKLL